MIKQVKKNRIEIELYKLLSSSKYIQKGKSLVLMDWSYWVIDIDHMVDTIFVFRRNLISMLGCDVDDETINKIVSLALKQDYKVRIVHNDEFR